MQIKPRVEKGPGFRLWGQLWHSDSPGFTTHNILDLIAFTYVLPNEYVMNQNKYNLDMAGVNYM